MVAKKTPRTPTKKTTAKKRTLKKPKAVVKAASAIVSPSKHDVDPEKQKALLDAKSLQVGIDDREQKIGLRGLWSTWIIGWITALITFNCVLIALVGCGYWEFDKWFGTVVTAEMFLQVVGLGYVAANFLFSDGSISKSKPEQKAP